MRRRARPLADDTQDRIGPESFTDFKSAAVLGMQQIMTPAASSDILRQFNVRKCVRHQVTLLEAQ